MYIQRNVQQNLVNDPAMLGQMAAAAAISEARSEAAQVVSGITGQAQGVAA